MCVDTVSYILGDLVSSFSGSSFVFDSVAFVPVFRLDRFSALPGQDFLVLDGHASACKVSDCVTLSFGLFGCDGFGVDRLGELFGLFGGAGSFCSSWSSLFPGPVDLGSRGGEFSQRSIGFRFMCVSFFGSDLVLARDTIRNGEFADPRVFDPKSFVNIRSFARHMGSVFNFCDPDFCSCLRDEVDSFFRSGDLRSLFCLSSLGSSNVPLRFRDHASGLAQQETWLPLESAGLDDKHRPNYHVGGHFRQFRASASLYRINHASQTRLQLTAQQRSSMYDAYAVPRSVVEKRAEFSMEDYGAI